MSFIDNLGKAANKTINYFREDPTGSAIAKTAILGFTLAKINNSINKQSDPNVNSTNSSTQGNQQVGVNDLNKYRVQVDPDTTAKIPVVYGEAYVGGKIIDAQLGSDRCKTMWFCLALSEQTGNLLDGSSSQISVEECYWNGNRIQFESDGITSRAGVNDDGQVNSEIKGKIRIYPFSGDSESPTNIGSSSNGNSANAYTLFPGWNTAKQMSDLVFVLISMDYFPSGDIRGLGTWQFKLKNTMTKPGDCVYDFMTNTRYGAGINPAEIDL